MKEEARLVFCQCIVEAWDSWFYTNVYPGCNTQWIAARKEEGALLSLLPLPVKTTQETKLYSAVVRGLAGMNGPWLAWNGCVFNSSQQLVDTSPMVTLLLA